MSRSANQRWRKKNLADSELEASGTSREARAGVCVYCRRPVLRGLDADRCAKTVEVDVYAVSELGEAVALLRGQATFDLVLIGGRQELNYRYRHHVSQARKHPVHVAHECSYVYEPAEEVYEPATPAAPLPDEPPF